MTQCETHCDAQYAIFDDMQGGFDFFHGYKFWLGGQKEFTVTDKYKGKNNQVGQNRQFG